MLYFCRLTWRLALPGSLDKKRNQIFYQILDYCRKKSLRQVQVYDT